MTAWGDDPELLATFRAEVEERLASLQAGLLTLEDSGNPKKAVGALFRDAHTVKGSAGMLGLTGVLHVSHSMEDLLGALRDGRFAVRTDLVDLLLASCDAIGRRLPAASCPTRTSSRWWLPWPPPSTALSRRPCRCSRPGSPCPRSPPPRPVRPRGGAPSRAARARRADAPGTSRGHRPHRQRLRAGGREQGVRPARRRGRGRPRGAAHRADDHGAAVARGRAGALGRTLRQATLRHASTLPPDVALALHRLVGAGDEVSGAVRGLRELVEGHRGGMALVRDGAMGLAMVPVRRAFATLPRIVRDVAQATGKTVRLETAGEDVEIDKQVLDGVADALKHLVVNAVDHGCEDAATRVAAGKPAEAVVRVCARGVAGTVVLEVSDDGVGVDEDAYAPRRSSSASHPDSHPGRLALLELLFAPAFSTASTGHRDLRPRRRPRRRTRRRRGARRLRRGRSEPGAGTAFVLTLPVTLGVLRCLLARSATSGYAVPVPGVVESLSLRDAEVHTLAGATVVVRHGVSIPLLDLGAALGLARAPRPPAPRWSSATPAAPARWSPGPSDRLEGESRAGREGPRRLPRPGAAIAGATDRR
jgi:chemotaxis protein histidine kinase CheA